MSRKPKNRPQPAAPPPRKPLSPFVGPALVALVALVATASTVVPDGRGPGITCDELYHVVTGKRLVLAAGEQGLSFFSTDAIRKNFPWVAGGPPMHPPLGHWFLGLSHRVFDAQPGEPTSVAVIPARLGVALTFGLLTLLVGVGTTRAEGPIAGTVAAAAVALVPRVFGHFHLAGLDPITALFCTAALFAVIGADRDGRWWCFALAGCVWGLAMLTRLHGLLLAPPILCWLVMRRRHRAAPGLAAWATAGAATFLLGWPWLWLDPVGNLRLFLGTATDRQAIHVFYGGRVWNDVNVPWHYPWVMFAVALPLGFLLLGLLGVWAKTGSKRREILTAPGYFLLLGTVVWFLAIFSWPGAPVYDGVRLFLPVFPLWAVSIGVGGKWLFEHPRLAGVPRRLRLLGLGGFVALQGIGLILYQPCHLSHYSVLVGGLSGADKLGFEATYWGDSVTEPLLDTAVRHAMTAQHGRPTADEPVVVFAPHLAPFQAPGVAISSPALLESGVSLVGWDRYHPGSASQARYAILYNRKADLAAVPPRWLEAEVVSERLVQGVWLARLVALPTPLGEKP